MTLQKLEAVQQAVTVTAPALRLPEEVKSSAQVILPGEVFSSAGALQDISRYVQLLPGVAIGSDDFRWDVRVDRTFTVRGEALIVFAGVQNLTNRRNWSGYSWDRRANAPRFDEQLGLFPILGVDWRF